MTYFEPVAVTSWATFPSGEIWPGTQAPRCDLNSSTDVSSTNGSNQFFSATANWKAGQVLVVRGAAATSGVYVSTITSVGPDGTGSVATCAANAGTTGSSLQAFWGTDDTVAWQTGLNAAPAGATISVGPTFATLVQQRLDSVTFTSGSSFVNDTSITLADEGKWCAAHPVSVTGTGPQTWTGIPPGSFVGPVQPGVGFTLVNGQGAPVLSTGTESSAVSMSIGGLFIPSFVQLCAEVANRLLASEVPVTIPGITTNIRTRGRVFGVVQCASLSVNDGAAAGSQAYSSPNAMFGLTAASAIGSPLIYSLNQVGYLAGTPTAFAPTVAVVAPSVGGWFVGSVFIPNCWQGISLQGGPGKVAHPIVGAFNVGMFIDHAYDYITVDCLQHGVWWDYIEGADFGNATGLDLYALNNLQLLVIGRCDSFFFNCVNAVIMSNGIVTATSPDSSLSVATPYGTFNKVDIDQASAIAVYITNANSPAIIINALTAGGNVQSFGNHQGGSGGIGIATGATASAKVKVASWAVRGYASTTSVGSGSTLIVPGTNPG